MTDFIYEDAFEPDVNIKVIGVGGDAGRELGAEPFNLRAAAAEMP